MKWNPFSRITKTNIHAKGEFITAPLSKRISDAFYAIWGSFLPDSDTQEFNTGVLDYPLVHLPAFFVQQAFLLGTTFYGFLSEMLDLMGEIKKLEDVTKLIPYVLELIYTLALTLVTAAAALVMHAI